MAKRTLNDDDQIAMVGRELRKGDWLANAQRRAKRRKSLWNLLLPLIGFPLWGAFIALLLSLASAIHTAIYPGKSLFHPGPMHALDTLVSLSALFAALAPALFITNILVYLIPPARRAMDAEDTKYPEVGYGPSQRALLKLGCWAFAIFLPLILIGAALK